MRRSPTRKFRAITEMTTFLVCGERNLRRNRVLHRFDSPGTVGAHPGRCDLRRPQMAARRAIIAGVVRQTGHGYMVQKPCRASNCLRGAGDHSLLTAGDARQTRSCRRRHAINRSCWAGRRDFRTNTLNIDRASRLPPFESTTMGPYRARLRSDRLPVLARSSNQQRSHGQSDEGPDRGGERSSSTRSPRYVG